MKKFVCLFPILFSLAFSNSIQEDKVSFIDLTEDPNSKIKWNGYWALGCDFKGGDFEQIHAQGPQCGQLCDESPICTHFAWNDQKNGTCWLKTGSVSKKGAFPVTNQLFSCGFSYFGRKLKKCGIYHNYALKFEFCDLTKLKDNFAYGCEFIGNEIFSKKTINDECKDLCDKFYGCTHYTWSPLDGGVCFLKSGNVSKEDAVRTNDLRFICGFSRPINPATCKVEKDWTKIQLPVTPLSSVSHCKPIDVFDSNSFSWRYSPLSVFNGERFKIGIEYSRIKKKSLDKYDYVTLWMNNVERPFDSFNSREQIAMLKTCKKHNKTAVFYAYVIAFEARSKLGLHDCDVDVDKDNLCTHGSCFIREHRSHLVSVYEKNAKQIAEYLGRYAFVVFLIEPDFWQYYGDPRQKCRLSGFEMRDLFRDFVLAIKHHLPNAQISWDISSWLYREEFCEWWNYFKDCVDCDIQYIHTSGGQSNPEISQMKEEQLEWSFVSRYTGRNIIADCGYGIAGAASDNCLKWKLNSNIRPRIQDGVVALSIANPFTIPKVNNF